MLYSILIYICILFGTANGECGYSSEFFQFDDGICDKVRLAYQQQNLDDSFRIEVSKTPDHRRCRGPLLSPIFNLPLPIPTLAHGLYSYIENNPGECTLHQESSILQSKCQAIKLTAVLGESADPDFAGSAQRGLKTLAQLHSLASVPVVIQFDTKLYRLNQLKADDQTLVAALNSMSSYKQSIYILLFEDPEEPLAQGVLFLAAWFSETTNRQGRRLPMMWMAHLDATGDQNVRDWQMTADPATTIRDSNVQTNLWVHTFDTNSLFCASKATTHFVQPTTDDRSFSVSVYPKYDDALGLNSGSVHFQIKIVNQAHIGQLFLKASCIAQGSDSAQRSESVGFGSRKRLTDDFGRFVVDPCGSPQLLGRYANPRDNSLAHVKCFNLLTNTCFSPISATGSIGFCWGTVSYFRANEICSSYGGSYDIPTYSQITSGPCCEKVERTAAWKSNLPGAMRSLSCHASSYLYWTHHTRASLADFSVFGFGTADAPDPTIRHLGAVNNLDTAVDLKFVIQPDLAIHTSMTDAPLGGQLVFVTQETLIKPVSVSLNYESSQGCDMLAVRFSFEVSGTTTREPLSYTRSWHVNTYQGFSVTFWPVPEVSRAEMTFMERELIRKQLSSGIQQVFLRGIQIKDSNQIGFAANSLIDFQSESGMPPDFKFMSENGHTFCGSFNHSDITSGQSDCITSYQVRFAGFLTTSVTEECEMWCEHEGDCILRVDGEIIYEGYADTNKANHNQKAEQCTETSPCTWPFLRAQYYEFSLAYHHYRDDRNLVQLRWKCPSMTPTHSGTLVTDSLTGGMTTSKGSRLVPHEVFWSKNAPPGLSYVVMPDGDCLHGTYVKFMLSHPPSLLVTVYLQSDTTGLSDCKITFDPADQDWRGKIVHVSPNAVSNVLTAVASSQDPSFHDMQLDVYLDVCPDVGVTSNTIMCILSFDGYFLTSVDPTARLPTITGGKDITMYYEKSATYNLEVSARVVICKKPNNNKNKNKNKTTTKQKTNQTSLCVVGGAVAFGDDAYGVYQEEGSNVLTFNDIGKSDDAQLRVEEDGFCTHFSAVTGFKVSFCLNDLKYVDIVVHIPDSTTQGKTSLGSCVSNGLPESHNDIYGFPRGFRWQSQGPRWCDTTSENGGAARSRIKDRNGAPRQKENKFQLQSISFMAPNGLPDYCSIGGYARQVLSTYGFSSPLDHFFSQSCPNSAVRFPSYVLRQSRNLIGYYFANHEYMSDTGSSSWDLKNAVLSSPFFCGGHAQLKPAGCRCTTSNGYSYPDCGGESYAPEAVFADLTVGCQNEAISVLSDPTTGAIWKCYLGECLSSKDGIKFEPIEDGEYVPSCFTGISWTDFDRTDGRTLSAYTNGAQSINSVDGGQSWQLSSATTGNTLVIDPAYNSGNFQGKVGNSWTITEDNLCLRSASLLNAKNVLYCTNWWCDCF